jgi:hypothetical protein
MVINFMYIYIMYIIYYIHNENNQEVTIMAVYITYFNISYHKTVIYSHQV